MGEQRNRRERPALEAQRIGPRTNLRSRAVAWWCADFDYEWMPTFLSRRGLTRMLKWSVGAWCAVFGLYVALLEFTVDEDTARWRSGLMFVLAASAFYTAIRWPITKWPSERRSLWFVLWADAALSIGLFAGAGSTSSPLAGSGLFVVIGIYVTLLHSSRILALHLGWAGATIGVAAAQYLVGDSEAEVALFAIRVLILVGLMTGIPLILHIGLQFLKEDAEGSHRDPLTGLLNRRGLAAEAYQLFSSARDDQVVIVTALADLDGFKSLNDRYGHASGDQALRAVAGRLHAAIPRTGLVARLGGDEFAAVVAIPVDQVDKIVARLHESINDSLDIVPVTASTGAWIRTGLVPAIDPSNAFATELHQADLAMYEAKNSGGDRLVCHSSTTPVARTRADVLSPLSERIE
ncbi:sensor domain-containing diguanylate cyclase [Antrihabitans stalactiti]|uniref:GGDEF domain-containing protein n=1 Tax=Antrihabitans stalactiti TaxID=2584121 RepID=A0A848K4E9_9NOCA|nr:GGDEF domain-containing protein [Antrihabitans stalactiti]NMN94005.1 GGDEF domain-containing protein [Antrihabitans stalactiti]